MNDILSIFDIFSPNQLQTQQGQLDAQSAAQGLLGLQGNAAASSQPPVADIKTPWQMYMEKFDKAGLLGQGVDPKDYGRQVKSGEVDLHPIFNQWSPQDVPGSRGTDFVNTGAGRSVFYAPEVRKFDAEMKHLNNRIGEINAANTERTWKKQIGPTSIFER